MVTWVKIVNIIGLNVGLVERFYFVLHYFEVAIIFKLAFQGDNEEAYLEIKRRKRAI